MRAAEDLHAGEVLCYGEIGPSALSAAHVGSEIARCEAVGLRAIGLRFRSSGGDCEEATRIIAEVQASQARGIHLTAIIEGRCDSSSAWIASMCDHVVAGPGASVLLHQTGPAEGWENCPTGEAAAMLRTCRGYDAAVAELLSAVSGLRGKPLPAAYFATLAAAETRLDADDLVRLGLVDEALPR